MDPAQRRYLDGFSAGSQARAARAALVRVPATALPPLVPAAAPVAATFEERAKRELHPLDAFPRLLACAETDQPPDAADRFRFEWFGLTYLAPATDGFRLRLRVPGGVLRTFQVREVAELARECASGCVKINRHAGLDLETVSLPDAPEALRRAEAAGLSARGTGGDNVVAMHANPMSGLDPGELIDVSPHIVRLEQIVLQGREFADLPRACEIAFHGGGKCAALDDPSEGDIVLSAWTMPPEVEPAAPAVGFRIGLAGLGDLGTSVRPDQAVHACLELLRIYLREADRTDRNRARLPAFFGSWDKDRCLHALESALGTKLPRRPPPARPSGGHNERPAAGHDGVTTWPQKQHGLHAVAIAAPQGRWLSAQWDEIAHLADIYGSGRIRLTAHRSVLIPGVLEGQLNTLQKILQERFCTLS